ncbi:MAG: Transcriptional activator protein CzcR [Planctomycetota bacterium]|jgi:two-component system response regulator GlrR
MTKKILIADDDRDLLASLSIRLQAAGYDVCAVQDSYQAVAQARRSAPDVLVLDINMPAGDGFTVQDRVDRMSTVHHVPVIYLTGERSERVASLTRSKHAFAVLYKPFDTADLLKAIQAATAQPRPAPTATQKTPGTGVY